MDPRLRRWVRRAERAQYDSQGKLRRLVEICEELGVRTRPAKVGPVWVVPLWSWYHASWDREPDVPGSTAIEKVRTLSRTMCPLHEIGGSARLTPTLLVTRSGDAGFPRLLLGLGARRARLGGRLPGAPLRCHE
jgi:hypothetical protein